MATWRSSHPLTKDPTGPSIEKILVILVFLTAARGRPSTLQFGGTPWKVIRGEARPRPLASNSGGRVSTHPLDPVCWVVYVVALRWCFPSVAFVSRGPWRRPDDVRQGALGNCWFMGAMAVMAAQPRLVEKARIAGGGGAWRACRVYLPIDQILFFAHSEFCFETSNSIVPMRLDHKKNIIMWAKLHPTMNPGVLVWYPHFTADFRD